MTEYLFLYGTLKLNQRATQVSETVKALRRVGPGTVPGKLYDFGDYPGAVLHFNSQERIHGEVFELPNDSGVSLAALDEYEEFDPTSPYQSLFIRERALAQLSDGRRLQCWIYVYNKEPGNAKQIASGDYSQSKVA